MGKGWTYCLDNDTNVPEKGEWVIVYKADFGEIELGMWDGNGWYTVGKGSYSTSNDGIIVAWMPIQYQPVPEGMIEQAEKYLGEME